MKTTRQTFIDANIFTYLITGHPVFGRSCQKLLEEVEGGDITGFISPLVIDEVSYILMVQVARESTGSTGTKSIKRIMSGIWQECLAPVNEFYNYLDHCQDGCHHIVSDLVLDLLCTCRACSIGSGGDVCGCACREQTYLFLGLR